MNCNLCKRELKSIIQTNIELFACINEGCNKYGVVVCDPYSYIDKCIKEILNGDKND